MPEPTAVPDAGDPSRTVATSVDAVAADAGRPADIGRTGGAGRLLRAGFLLVVLVLALYWVWRNRHGIGQAWGRVSLLPILGALVASALGAWSGVPAWRELLVGLGSRLRLRDAQRVYLMGQLGKYIPGGVWTVLAQATMAKELRVPRARSGTAGLMSILLSVVTAAGLGAVCLSFAGRPVLGRYWWVLLLLLPLLACLHPDVLVRAGRVAGRVTGRSLRLERIPERTLLEASGWLLFGQVCNGLSFYLLVESISGHHSNPLLPIGLFAFAVAAGIVVVFAPAGVGPRELILAFGLSAVTDPGSAALIVLMSRVVMTAVDVGLALSAVALVRRTVPSPAGGGLPDARWNRVP